MRPIALIHIRTFVTQLAKLFGDLNYMLQAF
jgi:hypothetical protein